MSALTFEVRQGSYFDSVILMQLQRKLVEREGVEEAGVVMGTQANQQLLASRELLPDLPEVSDQDLLIVVKAEDEGAGEAALAAVDDLLTRKSSAGGRAGYRPRTLQAAVDQLPGAQWVLISVPGRYAAGVAREALSLDRHVFLFSDNVALEDEIELKRTAAKKGRLLMGPDCGTALIGGAGFGFANRVRRGAVGLVAASGTGLQAVSSHLHALGGGVSQAIGTGGRDLKGDVHAMTTRQGLQALGRDPDTEVIVLISKPPDPDVVSDVLTAALGVGKPVVIVFQGWAPPASHLGPLHFARDFFEAAQMALELNDAAQTEPVFEAVGEGRQVRGLFSGGTLAGQLFAGLKPLLPELRSNVAPDPQDRPEDLFQSQGPLVLDLGADDFTSGRLHPMMDNELRLQRMRAEGTDPEVGLIALDMVLGEGAHPNPAAEFEPLIADLTNEAKLDVAVVLIGTEEDQQGVEDQREVLEGAGARVYRDVGDLLDDIARSLPLTESEPTAPIPLEHLHDPPAAINIGLDLFVESLEGQGIQVVGLDWRPPAQGDQEMMDLLARMKE